MRDLKRALDKISEIQSHDEEVNKAFTKGKKPPQKFSDIEYKTI